MTPPAASGSCFLWLVFVKQRMGASGSKPKPKQKPKQQQPNKLSKEQNNDALNKAGHYKAGFLKARWQGTTREGYLYNVGYAPTGAATCRQCKQKIAKGALRIGRSSPSPFDAEGGVADFTQYFHPEHAFIAFARSRPGTKVPLRERDMAGIEKLSVADRGTVKAAVAAFADSRKQELFKKAHAKQP